MEGSFLHGEPSEAWSSWPSPYLPRTRPGVGEIREVQMTAWHLLRAQTNNGAPSRVSRTRIAAMWPWVVDSRPSFAFDLLTAERVDGDTEGNVIDVHPGE
jgi:hypothetical protein